jgi:hypothetical protein
MTDDNDPARLQRGKSRLRGLAESKKRNILLLIILAVLAGVFFSALGGGSDAYADKPIWKQAPRPEAVDPLEKIGRSSLPAVSEKICQGHPGLLEAADISRENEKSKEREATLENLVSGYPIEQMVPYIARQNKTVAAFLVGIARKESTWGEHAPSVDGRDCYNYWGYRGGHNPTDSGYSCFDSPEQAVSVVGGRLQALVNQDLTTPARMVVWKCGGACAADLGAGGWISAVSGYFYKLNS